ncbi:hypothetical protein VIBNIPon4_370012 [Vibrio nigripulchritudo POn4]|nr:hypothetical protein VIBNIPon4_370012 [Vibrio nigripulchritudo POn4]
MFDAKEKTEKPVFFAFIRSNLQMAKYKKSSFKLDFIKFEIFKKVIKK